MVTLTDPALEFCRVSAGSLSGRIDRDVVTGRVDLSAAFAMAADLSRRTGYRAKIRLGEGDYYFTRGVDCPSWGIFLSGKGPMTRIHTLSTSGVGVRVPAPGGAYGSTTTVESDALGAYIRPDGKMTPRGSGVRAVNILAPEGTPATANREWSVLRICGHSTELDYFIDNAPAPRTSLKTKGYARCNAVAVGEGKFEQPNPQLARTVNDLVVHRLKALGEDLEATSEARTDGRFVALDVFKCSGGTIDKVKLGATITDTIETVMDVVLTGFPINTETRTVSFWDPWAQRQVDKVYTFVTATPATAYEVSRGANKEALLRNWEAKISRNCALRGGTDYLDIVEPLQAFGTANPATLRLTTIAAALSDGSDLRIAAPFGVIVTTDLDPATGFTLPYATGSTRVVSVEKSRLLSHWKYGIYIENSPNVRILDADVASSVCAKAQIAYVNSNQSLSSIFTTNPLTTGTVSTPLQDVMQEAGHQVVDNVYGDYVCYGSGMILFRGNGFCSTGQGVATGQNGIIFGLSADMPAIIDADRGNHVRKTLTLTADFADNDTVTLPDGLQTGGTVVLRAKTVPTTSNDFARGVSTIASLVNLHNLIWTKQRARAVRCWSMYPADLGAGTGAIDVTFFCFDHEYTLAPSVAEASATASWADASQPFLNTMGRFLGRPHWSTSGDACAAPNVRIKYFTGDVMISGHYTNQSQMSIAAVAQEVWLVPVIAVPAVTGSVNIRATAAGTRLNFIFNNGADTATNKFVYNAADPIGATPAAAAKALATKIFAVTAAGTAVNTGWGGAGAGTSGVHALWNFLGFDVVQIGKGIVEDDAAFITTDGDVAFTSFARVTGLALAAGVAIQRAAAPIVVENLREYTVDGVQAGPIPATLYVGGVITEAYLPGGALTAEAGNEPTINLGFAALPKILVSHNRTWSLPMKGSIKNCDLKGLWGAGRFGNAQLVDLAGTAVLFDITFQNNRINGLALA